VASKDSFVNWFAADMEPSQVCTDVDMSLHCADALIESEGGYVALGNMTLEHHGFATTCSYVHMRLDSNGSAYRSGVCSCTLDNNWWADSYAYHWGNALHIWLR
jgi:hypothetical protein